MKKLLLIFLVASVVAFTGCSKLNHITDAEPVYNVPSEWYLNLYNSHSDPYEVILDGKSYGILNPYKYGSLTLSLNTYGQLKLVQTSGYIFYATEYTFHIKPQNAGAKVNISF